MSTRTAWVAALLVLVPAGGCLTSHGGAPFDPIGAPDWKVGYAWTYRTVTSSQQNSLGRGGVAGQGDTHNDTMVVRVTNASADVEGTPSYILSVSPPIDHPLFSSDLIALSHASLEPLASGERGRPGSPTGPCKSTSMMRTIPPDERFPFLRFPLDDGRSQSGHWGFGGGLVLGYVVKTHGIVGVDVPAGHFQAVYVTTDLAPITLPGQDNELSSFRFDVRSEEWYSPDAEFLVKDILTATAQGQQGAQGGFQYSYRSTMELENVSLTTAEPEPAPDIAQTGEASTAPVPARVYQVVSNVSFPVNVANGTVAARFGLEEAAGAAPGGQAMVRPVVPDSLNIDHASHEVVWTVDDQMGPGAPTEFRGDVLNYTFGRGGRYDVRAEVRPVVCGGDWLGNAAAVVSTYWSRTFDVPIGVGLSRTIPVGSFPVESNAWQGSLETAHVMTGTTGAAAVAAGHAVLTDSLGHAFDASSSQPGYKFGPSPAGEWTLAWNTDAPTLQDHVSLTVLVSYSPDPPTH